MKQFRLKNKYPGLPDDWDNGMIIGHGERGSASYYSPINGIYTDKHIPYIQCKNYPIHWEEVKQRNYEILTVTAKPNHPNLPVGSIKDSWLNINMDYFDIHSIKRISDGEIFSVGDEIITGASDSYASIYGFKIIDNKLCINHTHSFLVNQMTPGTPSGCHLYLISKKKKPLFKTEDGINIFENKEGEIKYWTLYNGDAQCKANIWKISDAPIIVKNLIPHKTEVLKRIGLLRFSTKEAAENYRLLNKPCLSIEEVMSVAYNPAESRTSSSRKLKEIVKNKL